MKKKPPMQHELTVTCSDCRSMYSQGGLDGPSDLPRDEVLRMASHNPHCRVLRALATEKQISVSSSVETTDAATVTRYTVQSM